MPASGMLKLSSAIKATSPELNVVDSFLHEAIGTFTKSISFCHSYRVKTKLSFYWAFMRWREVDMFRMKDFESRRFSQKIRGCCSIDRLRNRSEVASLCDINDDWQIFLAFLSVIGFSYGIYLASPFWFPNLARCKRVKQSLGNTKYFV